MITGAPVVGLDAVEIPRFRRLLARRPALAARLFSDAELRYAARFADPVPHLAVRFAAKEAAVKALGVGLGAVRFHDVEVDRLASGAPVLVTRGRVADLARDQGVTGWEVSLTHTELLAAAVVVASRPLGWQH